MCLPIPKFGLADVVTKNGLPVRIIGLERLAAHDADRVLLGMRNKDVGIHSPLIAVGREAEKPPRFRVFQVRCDGVVVAWAVA